MHPPNECSVGRCLLSKSFECICNNEITISFTWHDTARLNSSRLMLLRISSDANKSFSNIYTGPPTKSHFLRTSNLNNSIMSTTIVVAADGGDFVLYRNKCKMLYRLLFIALRNWKFHCTSGIIYYISNIHRCVSSSFRRIKIYCLATTTCAPLAILWPCKRTNLTFGLRSPYGNRNCCRTAAR